MEILQKLAWLALVAIHLSPSLVFFQPSLTRQLYGVEPTGPVGLLIAHRGGLFLAIVAAALWGTFDPGARKACASVVAVSMISFLILYGRSGFPEGPLKTIAIVDLVGLVPLAIVVILAWRA